MAKSLPRTMHRKTMKLETELGRDAVHSSVFGPWTVRKTSPFRYTSTPQSSNVRDRGMDVAKWFEEEEEIDWPQKSDRPKESRPAEPAASQTRRHSKQTEKQESHEGWTSDRVDSWKRPDLTKTSAKMLVSEEVSSPAGSPMFVMSLESGSPLRSRAASVTSSPHQTVSSTPVSRTPDPEASRPASRSSPQAPPSKRNQQLPAVQRTEVSPEIEVPRPFTSLGFVDGPSKFEDILPASSGRKGGRSASVLWQQKRFLGIGYGAKHVKTPATGLRSSELVETEAAQVFGTGGDISNLQGMGKFIEARSLELRLADVISNGARILEKPPLSQARRKYYSYTIPAVFAVFAAVIDAVGPFSTILSQLKDQVHVLCYSEEIDHSDDSPRKIANVELVAQLRRDKENIHATLESASMLSSKSDKDIARLNNENKELEQRILQLERQLQAEKKVYGDLQEKLKTQKEEYDQLLGNFKELQKGFMLGQLQDEMKEILLEGVGDEDAKGAVQESSVMEEQSAMQRLVQQLKDARESMLTAKDDMNYWKAKYEGVEARMKTITESFHDTTNSLELTKEKMLGMVPSTVHVALKERYQRVLEELGRLTHQVSKDKKKNRQPHKTRERPHDNWRHYDFEEDNLDLEAPGTGLSGSKDRVAAPEPAGGAAAVPGGVGREPEDEDSEEEEEEEEEEHNELDDPDNNVPAEFVDSVAEQRDRLNQSYRNYRKLHGSAVVHWAALRTMSLAEFARLEEDCFSKNSIWALQLLKDEDAAPKKK